MTRVGTLEKFRDGCKAPFALGFLALAICGFSMPVLEATEYYAASDHPNASDSNNGLSLDQPFKTLSRAVQSLSAGDTLSIREGIYREALVPGRSGTADNPIVIRAYPGDEGNVVIRGSDVVKGWSNDEGNIWSVSWQPLPLIDYPDSFPDYGEHSQRREMVFVNGSQLNQVLSRSALGSGRFWMDDAAQRIRIYYSGDPNSSQVEISVRTQGVMARGRSYLVFRGLRVEHVTTEIWTGAMSLGAYPRVEDCRVDFNNGIGIEADSNTVIIRSTSNHNGREGISLSGNNSQLDSTETSYNSWRYGPVWVSGGIKVVGGGRPSGNRISRHTAKYNNGPGIWFDTTGSGNVVEESLFEGNVMWGLAFEATTGPNWAINNVVQGTSLAGIPYDAEDGVGILMREARDTYLYNNTIVGVEGVGILISGDERDNGEFYAAGTKVFNNIVVDSGTYGVYLWLWGKAVEEPRISSHRFDNNLYYNNPETIIFPDFSNGEYISWKLWSLPEWQENRGQDLASLDASPNFTRPSSLDFTLRADSPAIDAGRNLAEVTQDFSGSSRPRGLSTDIGAFESAAHPVRARRPFARRPIP